MPYAFVAALSAFGGAIGCAPDAPGTTPESTVRAFVSAMDRSSMDDRARAEALELLDASSLADLESRARRASHLARRPIEPWEMLAQGSLRLRVPLDRMQTEIDGDRAVVRVRGSRSDAEVPLVSEMTDEGPRWRLVLLPPTPSVP